MTTICPNDEDDVVHALRRTLWITTSSKISVYSGFQGSVGPIGSLGTLTLHAKTDLGFLVTFTLYLKLSAFVLTSYLFFRCWIRPKKKKIIARCCSCSFLLRVFVFCIRIVVKGVIQFISMYPPKYRMGTTMLPRHTKS